MKSKCTVCNHPQLAEIDLALLAGRTLESLHQQYGPSPSAFQRHKNHLREKMSQTQERFQDGQKQVSLLKLNAFLDYIQKGVETAAAQGDIDRVFKGADIGSRIIHQINKMEVHLELDTLYRLLSAPGFVSQDAILPTGPRIIADLHQALVDRTFSPCPDPPEETPAQAQLAEQAAALLPDPLLETRNPKPETPTATWPLAPDPCLLTQNSELETAFNDRPTSGKLPTKTDHLTDKSMQKQPHKPSKKNFPAKPSIKRPTAAPPATLENSAPLETRNSKLETPNSELETPSAPCPSKSENRQPKTENRLLKTVKRLLSRPKPPPPYDETARRADELFEIAHGYKRNNPPKHIPDRRRDEDFRSRSVFGDVKNILKHM